MTKHTAHRLRQGILGVIVSVWSVFMGALPMAQAQEAVVRNAVLEDYRNTLTTVDTGFNAFSGNMGVATKDGLPYGESHILCNQHGTCFDRLTWDFGTTLDAFVGKFYSLLGLTDTKATFDGTTVKKITFPEHRLDLDDVDHPLIEPGGPRRFRRLGFRVRYASGPPLHLRVELQDTQKRKRFQRFPLTAAPGFQTLTWAFRDPEAYREAQPKRTDLRRAKVVSLVIERQHVADGIDNPPVGTLDIQRLWFVPSRPESEPTDDNALQDLLARRAVQYFLDWGSRKAASLGIPQDRSTFGDLLTVGGVGFALPAYFIAAERGWLARTDAAQLTVSVLRILDNPAAFGTERVGRLGYKGFFYHFLGVDGHRKLNFDFPETPGLDESKNTVEISPIDTALAVFGILAAQSYFTRGNALEAEIRTRAQQIYDRIEWPWMLNAASQQFYLGWKPLEAREGPLFEVPDAAGEGHYSGTVAKPATWDWYTDEILLITLLALGSTTHPVPDAVYCAFRRERSATGVIRSYPGSLFTYQFLHAFLDTARLGTITCPGLPAENWGANAQQAMREVLDYATSNPDGLPTYGPNAWGITACEGPEDAYHAYGAPPVASNPAPEQDGTVGYYGMLSAAGFPAFGTQVRGDLRAAWDRGHWHWRFGLPDAFHSDVSRIVAQHPAVSWVRRSGPWIQRALFAIDQGPMALHFENARSGLLWNRLAANANIQRAVARLPRATPPDTIRIQGEAPGTGDGIVQPRSNASGLATLWLRDGQRRTWSVELPAQARYTVQVRYSNDNLNSEPLEEVEVLIDGTPLPNKFFAKDTGDFGDGWNNFVKTKVLGTIELPARVYWVYPLQIKVTGGDGYGVEIDVVTFERVP